MIAPSLRSAHALGALSVVLALGLAACGESDPGSNTGKTGQEIHHIHGLGINPADDALMVATHTGLFRSAQGSREIERVGLSAQDTMGFTVVGANRFLGSGHPAPGEGGPPNLGLIESTDGGETWQEISLAGEADFHILRFAQERIYGYNGLTGKLMLSSDGGRSWEERTPPPGLVDLAVDPDDPERILASSSEQGLAVSEDEGQRWQSLSRDVGLIAWPDPKRLYLIDSVGRVRVSADGGRRWQEAGSLGQQPVALTAERQELYAALADGSVLRSADGGASWLPRVSP